MENSQRYQRVGRMIATMTSTYALFLTPMFVNNVFREVNAFQQQDLLLNQVVIKMNYLRIFLFALSFKVPISEVSV